jgi:hypothetical protein
MGHRFQENGVGTLELFKKSQIKPTLTQTEEKLSEKGGVSRLPSILRPNLLVNQV